MLQPTGEILEVTLRDALKDYGEERLVKCKDSGRLVGYVPYTSKINRGNGQRTG